jgi:hypothetical protein
MLINQDYSMVKSASPIVQDVTTQISAQAMNISTINCKAETWAMVVGYFTPNVTGTWTLTVSTDGMSFLWLGGVALESFKDKNTLLIKNNDYNYDLFSVNIDLVSGTVYPLRYIYGNEGTSCLDFAISFTAPGNSFRVSDISDFVDPPEKYPLNIWSRPPVLFNVAAPQKSIISFKRSLTYYLYKELFGNGTSHSAKSE